MVEDDGSYEPDEVMDEALATGEWRRVQIEPGEVLPGEYDEESGIPAGPAPNTLGGLQLDPSWTDASKDGESYQEAVERGLEPLRDAQGQPLDYPEEMEPEEPSLEEQVEMLTAANRRLNYARIRAEEKDKKIRESRESIRYFKEELERIKADAKAAKEAYEDALEGHLALEDLLDSAAEQKTLPLGDDEMEPGDDALTVGQPGGPHLIVGGHSVTFETKITGLELEPTGKPPKVKAGDGTRDQGWREYSITNLDLSKGIEDALREAKLETIGAIAEFTDSGKVLTGISGIGTAKAMKITTALQAFWDDIRARELADALKETPSDVDRPMFPPESGITVTQEGMMTVVSVPEATATRNQYVEVRPERSETKFPEPTAEEVAEFEEDKAAVDKADIEDDAPDEADAVPTEEEARAAREAREEYRRSDPEFTRMVPEFARPREGLKWETEPPFRRVMGAPGGGIVTSPESSPHADDRGHDWPESADTPPSWKDRIAYDVDGEELAVFIKGTRIKVVSVIVMVLDGWTWGRIAAYFRVIKEADVHACVQCAALHPEIQKQAEAILNDNTVQPPEDEDGDDDDDDESNF